MIDQEEYNRLVGENIDIKKQRDELREALEKITFGYIAFIEPNDILKVQALLARTKPPEAEE